IALYNCGCVSPRSSPVPSAATTRRHRCIALELVDSRILCLYVDKRQVRDVTARLLLFMDTIAQAQAEAEAEAEAEAALPPIPEDVSGGMGDAGGEVVEERERDVDGEREGEREGSESSGDGSSSFEVPEGQGGDTLPTPSRPAVMHPFPQTKPSPAVISIPVTPVAKPSLSHTYSFVSSSPKYSPASVSVSPKQRTQIMQARQSSLASSLLSVNAMARTPKTSGH
ncbi:hypothetical protein KIPB_007820, partial [Kipferlia bialata]